MANISKDKGHPYILLIPLLSRQRQGDREFEANIGYVIIPCLKNTITLLNEYKHIEEIKIKKNIHTQ